MRFTTVFLASVLLLSNAISVFAKDNGSAARQPDTETSNVGGKLIPSLNLNRQDEQPVLMAQVEPSQQLQEQIRLLNGKVEEMNFLVLQLQEQMRKMQEDNEFRFQELEKSKQGSAGAVKDGNSEAAAPATPKNSDVAAVPPEGAQAGTPEKQLGSIKFDENGNTVGTSVENVIENTDVASVPPGENAEAIYRVAYDHVLAGEYGDAEGGFRSHIEQFPKDKQTADARYWLGEALAGQGKHREAAEILLDAQRDYPKAKKAPDMLLKLGVSLAELDNKDVACATFAQIGKKYPKAGPTLLSRVAEEQAKTGC